METKLRRPNQTLSFGLFASTRINERRYRLSLDAHRYIEVVEAQGDGQLHMLSGSTRTFTLDQNISDRACTSTTAQSMENEKATYKMLKLCSWIPTRLTSEKIGSILRLQHSTPGRNTVHVPVSMYSKRCSEAIGPQE